MNRLSAFFLLTMLFSAQANALESSNTEIPAWSEEQAEIIAVSRFVALAPKELGFEEYSNLFHPDFTSWYMRGGTESLRTREQYLALVRDWLDEGNYAISSEVNPISIEIFGDIAYVRQVRIERFHNPNGEPTMFVGHFASLMKKHNGQWTFYRTSFDTRYRGPMPTQPTQD